MNIVTILTVSNLLQGCKGIRERIVLEIRQIPLYESQKEIYCSEAYSVFQYSVRPTFNLMQEVLSHGANVEVLTPIWFRQQVADVTIGPTVNIDTIIHPIFNFKASK